MVENVYQDAAEVLLWRRGELVAQLNDILTPLLTGCKVEWEPLYSEIVETLQDVINIDYAVETLGGTDYGGRKGSPVAADSDGQS